jgi:YHS domain-containing protein
MNKITSIILVGLVTLALAGSFTVRAEEKKTEAPKPYPLKTCLVCGMELDPNSHPYVFVYQGQEIKLCDKSEKADFDKDPAKYMKKLKEAEAKEKK